MRNIVLVHGGFVDGAGWEGVYKILKRDGYSVGIVQNPTISLEDDVAITKRILTLQDGPTTLVGHSYGGAVILKDNALPEAAAVYAALDVPWATLVGQISKAYSKQSAGGPMNVR